MRPVLFTWDWGWGPFPVRAYETALLLAAALAVTVSCVLARRRGLPRGSVLVVLLGAGAAALVGARAACVFLAGEWGPGLLERLLDLRAARFSLSGGLLSGLFAGWALSRQQGLCAWRLADACAPAIAIGIATTRVGCFLHGCCFGGETGLPLGIRFPWGSPAHLYQLATGKRSPLDMSSLPVHPSQLYELVAALLAAAMASLLLRRNAPDGMAVLASAALFLSLRGLALTQRAIADPAAWLHLTLLGVVAGLGSFRVYEEQIRARSLPAARQ